MDTYNYIKDKSNFFQYIDRCEHQYRIYSRNCSEQSKMLVIPEYQLENFRILCTKIQIEILRFLLNT